MYHQLYGLKKSPFNITADPHFFFESISHKEALAALFYGLHEKKGIILITGEVGTGKTTLCKTFLDKLSDDIKTSVIFNPYFSEAQLLRAIAEDFGLEVKTRNRLGIIKQLNSFLIEINSSGGNAVLVIDEAQNLNSRQLEQVRLLSNLETFEGKLLQIILSGQPELTSKLAKDNLRQIRQRIFVKHNIRTLGPSEVKKYINFRLKKAGLEEINITPSAHRLIYEFSKGTPRLVNMLCDRAMLLGFVKESETYDEDIFRACIEELK
mgnify:CR=1 FL=1